MNPTPYTDDQILAAIEQALGSSANHDMIVVRLEGKLRAYGDSEKAVRLQIGKKFLELLSKPQPEPKTFTFAGLEWNKHTPGDPMPCEPEALVQVVMERELEGRDEWEDEAAPARKHHWGVETDEWLPIVGWRYADKPEQHPDTKEMWERTKEIIEESKAQMQAEAYEVHPDDLHLLDCEKHVNETDFVNIWTPKPGDVVQLKSGGPKMTVRLPQDENYLCTWTSDNGVFERFFPLACLQQA